MAEPYKIDVSGLEWVMVLCGNLR